MKLPYLEQAVVPEAKLTGYLLNPLHPKGRSKAAFLLHVGFTPERADELRRALLAAAGEVDMVEIVSPYGLKYTGAGVLRTPTGTDVAFRTMWVLLDNVPPPFFVTAYPAQEG